MRAVTVADARFAKPIDGDLAVRLAQSHQVLITLEEASATGGFGTAVLTHLHTSGALQGVSFAIMGVPEGVMLAKSRTECLR